MDRKELELYMQPEFIRTVEENFGRDPLDIALDRTVPHAREVATRVKYLRKARTKLPSYYKARCIIPQKAYEQSSGESSAFSKKYEGGVCLDLTCGLGVDSFAFSRGFERVIAIEPDTIVANIAKYNFGLLGAENIEVVNMTAEEYLEKNPGLQADLVYIDPDRRNDKGRKMSALGDCSPDVSALLPRLKEMAGRVVIKLSPLFDVHEAFRIFGQDSRVTAVSEGGECKEVLVETGRLVDGPVVAARVLGQGEVGYPYTGTGEAQNGEVAPDINSFGYLTVPDVALVKTGTAARYYTGHGLAMPSQKGYAYGIQPPENMYGRTFRIVSVERYSPRKLKARLKQEGVTRLNIMLRDFPDPVATITRQLGIKEGGGRWAAFTTYGGEQYCVFLSTN